MQTLSASELAAMRATAEDALPDTAVIWTVTNVSDGQGGMTATWAAAGTADCRISPSGTGSERELASRLSSVSPWYITLPQGTAVTVKDRIHVGARVLEVAAIMAPRTWELTRRLIAIEVT